MLRFIALRLLQAVAVLFLVYSVTFWMLMAAPGDPFVGEKNPPEAVRIAMAEKYGLEYLKQSKETRAQLTWPQRLEYAATAYVSYTWRILRNRDFGPSVEHEDWTIREIIFASLPVSISLGSLALLIALWLGVAAGALGAVSKGRWPDMALTVAALFGVSLPTFVVGTILLMLFAVYWPVLPVGGWGRVSQLVLPALTLAVGFLAYISRLARVSVLDVLSADYVRTARAKGLSQHRVLGHHVLRNAALPVLSYLGPAAAAALTGSFVVEKVFAVPGLGTHFVHACLHPDIPLVLGSVLVYTAVVVAFNLLVDLAYAAVDPRVALT